MTTMNRQTVHPGQVVDFLHHLVDCGDVTKEQARRIGARAVKYGSAWHVHKGVRYTIPPEAITCDCGSGLCCPLITQRKVGAK